MLTICAGAEIGRKMGQPSTPSDDLLFLPLPPNAVRLKGTGTAAVTASSSPSLGRDRFGDTARNEAVVLGTYDLLLVLEEDCCFVVRSPSIIKFVVVFMGEMLL